jgi:hypothetical protein
LGATTEIVGEPGIVESFKNHVIFCPAVTSNSIIETVPDAPVCNDLGGEPTVVLAVAKTFAAVKVPGGTTRSAELVAEPDGVVTVIFPEDDGGTVIVSEVVVAAVTVAA